MKAFTLAPVIAMTISLSGLALLPKVQAQELTSNLAYAEPAHERQVLDVYSSKGAKNKPVVFWIHGGGWQAGDKTSVQIKPQAFVDKGFVFVSTNYRLLPNVDMETIVRDVAKAPPWGQPLNLSTAKVRPDEPSVR